MDVIINENVTPEELKKFEKIFNEQCRQGQPSAKAQFEYSWCLIRSRYGNDLRKGLSLLEDLYHKTQDDSAKRDYLFYLAVGNTRLKEYTHALRYADAILKVEPRNHQVHELKTYIDKKMKKEGLVGMAIVGGAALALGGLVGLGVALAKK
ncbi:mitochondrial fission 1 protein-like [Lineus longissimus]|uniref:mitochondrial fission 1 protein-like n=1 Tax=Lineus longissimus TaxID=88925 RepID=UPI002B4CDCC0